MPERVLISVWLTAIVWQTVWYRRAEPVCLLASQLGLQGGWGGVCREEGGKWTDFIIRLAKDVSHCTLITVCMWQAVPGALNTECFNTLFWYFLFSLLGLVLSFLLYAGHQGQKMQEAITVMRQPIIDPTRAPINMLELQNNWKLSKYNYESLTHQPPPGQSDPDGYSSTCGEESHSRTRPQSHHWRDSRTRCSTCQLHQCTHCSTQNQENLQHTTIILWIIYPDPYQYIRPMYVYVHLMLHLEY